MEFKQYPSYKPSGVEWLGDVPEHWQIVRTKDIFNHRKEEALEDDEIVTAFRDGQVTLRKNRRTDGFTNSIKEHGYQHINSGDLVIHEMDAFAGAIGVSDSSGKSTPVYSVCYAKNENINHHFYSHFFRTMAKTGFINSLAKGIRVRSTEFRWNESRNVYLVEPPKSDQQKIVAFLDTETTRIDNLIAKQEKLIELLEEQRKSIISHAVTKGLNPDAPMKDSGVEWLGDVPEHWTVLKNRHIFNFSKGLSITKENLQESGIPCVSYGEVHSKFGFEFNPEIDDMKFVSEEYLKTSKNCLLNSGDFIFADTSEDFEGSGNFSYLNSNSQVFAGYHTVIARLKSKQKPRFFAYIFDSNAHRKQIQTQVKGIKVFSITQGILKDIYSWLPPVHEQDLIVEYLDNECKKISLLKAKQIELIEKLKEYRSSIISHAVTGKIDVREFGT
jgi:type I restriction enzyme S subunit